jgi:D-sedoheptulose 7-phosphate isomerase
MNLIETIDRHNQAIATLEHDCIERCLVIIKNTIANNGKILICGNGGSAADAQHLAAELMVRYNKDRQPIPAIALTTDSSILTAHSNDYDFDTVFSRQVEALGNPNDLLILFSTSGQSKNCLNAANTAHTKGMDVISLVGTRTTKLLPITSCFIVVDSEDTARIQEAHQLVYHYWCSQLD